MILTTNPHQRMSSFLDIILTLMTWLAIFSPCEVAVTVNIDRKHHATLLCGHPGISPIWNYGFLRDSQTEPFTDHGCSYQHCYKVVTSQCVLCSIQCTVWHCNKQCEVFYIQYKECSFHFALYIPLYTNNSTVYCFVLNKRIYAIFINLNCSVIEYVLEEL